MHVLIHFSYLFFSAIISFKKIHLLITATFTCYFAPYRTLSCSFVPFTAFCSLFYLSPPPLSLTAAVATADQKLERWDWCQGLAAVCLCEMEGCSWIVANVFFGVCMCECTQRTLIHFDLSSLCAWLCVLKWACWTFCLTPQSKAINGRHLHHNHLNTQMRLLQHTLEK